MNDVNTPLSVKIGQDVLSPQVEFTSTVRFEWSKGGATQLSIDSIKSAISEWCAKQPNLAKSLAETTQ